MYSMLAAQLVGRTGRVYTFEPDPVARRFLESNLSANGASNVEVLSTAVSNRLGAAVLDTSYLFGSVPLFGMSDSDVSEESDKGIVVATTTLDEFSARMGVIPNMIKIDVEGREVEVVNGGLRTLGKPQNFGDSGSALPNTSPSRNRS